MYIIACTNFERTGNKDWFVAKKKKYKNKRKVKNK